MKRGRDFLLFTAILTIIFGSMQIKSKCIDFIPLKAFVIFTSESWGCLSGQKIKEDVSASIKSMDDNVATIHEIKNPEDVFNRYELYIVFPATQINGLRGSFAAKFWCSSDKPETKAFFSIDQAKVSKKDNEPWTLSLRIKSNGFVRSQMLYSRKAQMRQGWFSCFKSREPIQVQFFNVFPLEGNFGGLPQEKLSGKWQDLELTFNPLFLENSVSVDKCQAFFSMMDKKFATAEYPMIWEFQKVNIENIQKINHQAKISLNEETFQVLIKADDGVKIYLDSDNFVPHLRQKLALKYPDGKLVGAELLIRAGW